MASTKQPQNVRMKSGTTVTASASSVIRSSLSAATRHYQSPQSDNSFDAEYCDVEPDSSLGSMTNGDVADLAVTVSTATTSDNGRDTLSSSSVVQAWLGSTKTAASLTQPSLTSESSRPSVVASNAIVHSTLPAFSSATIADLPKSSFALTFDKFPSPVKYSSDLFSPVLPPPATNSLVDYAAPVMAAESIARCLRFLPATAAALCDTSTVSSPSFARSLCAAVPATAKQRRHEPSMASESGAVVGGTSMPYFVSGLPQHSTVVSSSTPVRADVLQAQLDQGSIHQLSAAGLPVMRTAVDSAVLNALLSQAQLGIPKTDTLAGATGRQQVLPNDLTVPVIAFLNLGAGTGSLPSFSCAAVLPPGALQFLKVSLPHESNTSSHASCAVSSSEQARLV